MKNISFYIVFIICITLFNGCLSLSNNTAYENIKPIYPEYTPWWAK